MSTAYKIMRPDGEESIPMDRDSLLEYARMGYVDANTLVFDSQIGNWLPAEDVDVFQDEDSDSKSATGHGIEGPPPAADHGPGAMTANQSESTGPDPGIVELASAGMAAAVREQSKGFSTLLVIAIIVAAFFVTLISGVGVGKYNQIANAPKPVTTLDGRYSIDVPGTWNPPDHHDAATVEYDSGDGRSLTLTVLTPDRVAAADFDHLAITQFRLETAANHASSTIGGVTPTSIAGLPARSYAYDTTDRHTSRTLISTLDGVYSVTFTTPSNKLAADQAENSTIASSFRGTPKATQPDSDQ
ncbi:MAG: hypothetical protein ACLQVD_08970 [Capsulimonadaceae bacterium]